MSSDPPIQAPEDGAALMERQQMLSMLELVRGDVENGQVLAICLTAVTCDGRPYVASTSGPNGGLRIARNLSLALAQAILT